MPRRATPLDPSDGPQARFALALRRLRDEAGFNAKTIDVIAAENHMPRSTLYAALRGARIPTVPVLAALVRAWGGDQAEWLIRRTETEAEIERLRLRAHVSAKQVQSGPREGQGWDRRLATRRGRETVNNILQQQGELDVTEIREPRPEDLMVKPWSDENQLAHLRSHWENDQPFMWDGLRRIAGAPTIRSIARYTALPQAQVARILKGRGMDPRQVETVFNHLNAQAEIRCRKDRTPEP